MNKKALMCFLGFSVLYGDINEYSLEKSTISASGFLQDIKEAPATINVITAKELENKPYRDIAEVISDIPGVDLYASKGKTGNFNITMRGIRGYTLILIDGRRQGIGGEIGPNGFGETLNATLPPLSSIERIEVIKGPMSTLYGSEALGGVINIITKKVSDTWATSVSFDTLLHQDKAWGNTYSTGIFASGPLLEKRLGVNLRFRQSYREQSEVIQTSTRGQKVPANQAQSPTKANNFNLGTRINFLFDEQNTFTYDVDFSKNHYDNSRGQLGTLTTSGTNAGDLRGGYERKMNISKLVSFFTHQGVYEKFLLNSGLQYNRVTNDGRQVVGQSTVPFLGQNRDIRAEDIILDSKAVIPLGLKNILSLGAEYRLEKMRDKIATPTSFDQYLIGVFAEDEFSILENLRLTLGTRFNKHEIFGNNLSPRGYFVYNFNQNFTIKGGISTGFKTPYANRLIAGTYNYGGQGRFPIYGNPNLKEETSINYEITAAYTNDFATLSLTGFLTDFKDKISTDSYSQNSMIQSLGITCTAARCIQATNHGKVQYKGVEFGAGFKPLNSFDLDFAYTFLDTEIKESQTASNIGKPETGTLKHNIIAKASYKAFNKIIPWIKTEYQIDRYMGNADINREYYKNVFLASLGISYEINKNWSINASIYNLFDKDFTDSYETYTTTSNSTTTTNFINTYNRIEEGRRLYLAINGKF
ncbi:TonB-dependent receptor [Campylobacter sp. MIT 21-1685]|uniref:TonB-dependent receptor domain-containing protein n=1 Tax=unclassified Campylobacter TaxID=2593542 RepID=UPI00224A9497|nr:MULTISPECIES: TonB-dependent receptor [unclassified Campylobacter]MCX2683435.1 TonB-dependent receptor [Campylobacter sp. MIT 21-1684]MCX2751744.1 TonB-dependent receptor [Campylobacter sp. MIT 21-1682]MCX2807945.1 TonB-dependent receptor [Campylobacter sp. MIT 21-1685]